LISKRRRSRIPYATHIFTARYRGWVAIIVIFCVLAGVSIGALLGVALGETVNIQKRTDFGAYRPALPSLLLDRRGKLITEYFAEERREIVSIYDLPKYLLQAVVTKEDRSFFSHRGFSVKGILRAAYNIMAGHYFSGGSTISQQVAGNLYEDRSDTTLGRKFAELWWSFQLEKKRSKLEILEIYLNNSKFGHGNYGVESASHFYFDHSARDLSLAEATLLTVHLSNPETRSMINYPNRARSLQTRLLDDMTAFGYIEADTAAAEFGDFWQNFEPVRANDVSTHTELDDRAIEFSSLIRRRFEELFFGSPDLFRDGFIIHSGLDLDYQSSADILLDETVERLGRELERDREYLHSLADKTLLPLTELVGTVFGMEGIELSDALADALAEANARYLEPLLLLDAALTGGLLGNRLDYEPLSDEIIVVGELVAIDNQTGHILAFSSRRTGEEAVPTRTSESRRSVGTAMAPFIFAEGVESGRISTASLLFDSPSFITKDEKPVVVPSIAGRFLGPVPAWRAVSNELVAPLTSIIEMTGADRIESVLANALGGAFGPEPIVPVNPSLAFEGIFATTLQVAKAMAVFPREGRPSIPLAIRYIEDRNGTIVYNNEQDALRERPRSELVITGSAAHVVVDAMKRTLSDGSLARRVAEMGGLARGDFAAVSGSTPDWADAWIAGYSSHITTVVWIGLDRQGETLGQYQTGASVAGSVWMRFMADVHDNLPYLDHDSVPNGVIYRQVCAVSGLLPTLRCIDGIDTVPFLIKAEPKTLCEYHSERDEEIVGMYTDLLERFKRSELAESITSRSPNLLFELLPDVNDGNELPEIESGGTNPYLE
jgi:penicillin-binding protein 1A